MMYNGPMRHPGLVVVKRSGSQPEADIAKSLLEAASIDAIIQADTAGGIAPHLRWPGSGFQVLVRDTDRAVAHKVLERATKRIRG